MGLKLIWLTFIIKFHDTLIKNYTEMIPLVANAGFKILFALAEIEIKQTKKKD
jgi:hypothetical protein